MGLRRGRARRWSARRLGVVTGVGLVGLWALNLGTSDASYSAFTGDGVNSMASGALTLLCWGANPEPSAG